MGSWETRVPDSVPTTSENQGSLGPPVFQSGGSFSKLGGPQAKNLKNVFL